MDQSPLKSVFQNMRFQDILIGIGIFLITCSFLFFLDWNNKEIFHGSPSEIQTLEKRIELLEAKLK